MRPARFAWLADRQRASRRLVLRATLVLVALGLVIPAAARADGDPASDYLYTARVFVPTGTPRAAQLRPARAGCRCRQRRGRIGEGRGDWLSL